MNAQDNASLQAPPQSACSTDGDVAEIKGLHRSLRFIDVEENDTVRKSVESSSPGLPGVLFGTEASKWTAPSFMVTWSGILVVQLPR